MKEVVQCMISNNKAETLFIKRADDDSHAGSWEFPGGGLEENESLLECCIREVKEETGLSIDKASLISTEILNDTETGEPFKVYLFESIIGNETPDLSNNPDHSEYVWATQIKLEDLDGWTQKQLIKIGFH